MAIYDYSKDSHHAGGAKCLRVVVTIGSEVHQHYFAKGDYKAAGKCEADLLKRRDAYNRNMSRTRKPNVNMGLDYTRTGVSGIRINVKKQRGRKNQIYYRCILYISVMSTETGGRFNKALIVTKDTLRAQWYEACTLLAKNKGRLSAPKAWLDECPSSRDFEKTIRGYMDNNLLLDIGFKSLPKSKYPKARSNVIKG